jgi:hypothetical protein
MCVCVKIEILNFEILHTSEFGFLFVVVRVVFFLDGEDVNFGDCCCIILCFKPAENNVDETLSSLKVDVLLWNEKRGGSLFVIFCTSKMILHI